MQLVAQKNVRLTAKNAENVVSRALPSSRTMPIPIQSYKLVCIALGFSLYLPDVIYTVSTQGLCQFVTVPLRCVRVDKVQGAGGEDKNGFRGYFGDCTEQPAGRRRASGRTAKSKRQNGEGQTAGLSRTDYLEDQIIRRI